jgi:hypothetical protein
MSNKRATPGALFQFAESKTIFIMLDISEMCTIVLTWRGTTGRRALLPLGQSRKMLWEPK